MAWGTRNRDIIATDGEEGPLPFGVGPSSAALEGNLGPLSVLGLQELLWSGGTNSRAVIKLLEVQSHSSRNLEAVENDIRA